MDRQGNTNMNPFLQAALYYANKGFAVFPLMPNSKDPATPNGFYNATTDPALIRRLWTPNTTEGVAIATGDASGGLFVVDLDEKHGHHALAALDEWQREHGNLPETCEVLTSSGGMHLYFHTDRETSNANPEIDGVDVRGTGGYVVAPPTVVGGKKYEWEVNHHIEDMPVAEADDLVFEFIRPKQKPDDSPAYQVPETIEQGGRTSAMMQIVGSMVAKGYAPDTIRAAVRSENQLKCKPPLTDEELEREVFPALDRGWAATNPYSEDANKKSENADKKFELPELRPLSEFRARSAKWLISGYIPTGDITILAGDGGAGKTYIWCDIVAALSTGHPCLLEKEFPFPFQRNGQKVAFFSSEDSIETQLLPRLQVFDANMDNILAVPLEDPDFGNINFNNPGIEHYILKHHPSLMVFDPIQSFLPPGVKMSQRNEMRAVMNPLVQLGKKYDVSFLIIVHTNKLSGVWGRKRISDSADIWDIARSVLIAGDTGENDLKYVSQEKSNYSARSRTVLFRLTNEGRVDFRGTTEKSDQDFVMAQAQTQVQAPARNEAKEMILSYLEDNGDECEADDLEDAMKAMGISRSTLNRAKSELKADGKIKYRSEGGNNKKKWYCRLVK